MLLRLLSLQSMETVQFYLLAFQSRAGRAQAGDQIWCSGAAGFTMAARFAAMVLAFYRRNRRLEARWIGSLL